MFELGEKYDSRNFKTLNERLRIAYQLADLLDYLEHSPIGSVYMSDLEKGNLVMVDGQLKLSDIDRMNTRARHEKINGTEYYKDVKAKHMMGMATRSIFAELLRADSSGYLKEDVEELLTDLKKQLLTAAQLKERLKEIDPELQ